MAEKVSATKGLLESALHRPYQTFDGVDLYPEPTDKAAAIFESIITNHPFVDGNKRAAYVLMRLLLMEHGLDLSVGLEEKYAFVIKAARGELRYEQIKNWISTNLRR